MRKMYGVVRSWAVAFALLFMLLTPYVVKAQTPAASTNAPDGQVITRRTFTDLAKKVIPSVVTVYVKRDMSKSMTPEQKQQYDQMRKFFEDPFLRQFLPPGMPGPGQNNEQQGDSIIMRGSGSGVIVSADGYIVTNWHVVGNKKELPEIRVVFSDDTELGNKDIEILESSELIDLALLKVKKTGLTPISLGNSDKVQIGDWVAAIGSPLELKETITQGIISAKHRELGSGLGDMLQTDAAINPGSSGGALVNLDGELVGINRMIASPGGAQWAGYGFAIPSSQVKYFIDQVKATGKISFGYIGLAMAGEEQDSVKMREALGFKPDQKGVLIMGVTPNGPAAKAGLKEGDMILSVDGREVNDPSDLLSNVVRRPVGSTVKMTYMRPAQGGAQPEEKTAEVQVTSRPSEEALAKGLQGGPTPEEGQPEQGKANDLGVQVEPYRDKSTEGLKVTAVMPGSPADKAGIKPGDVLLKMDWVDLTSEQDLAKALKARTPGKPAPLYIMRGGQKFLIPID